MRTVSQGFIDASVSPIGYASAYITIGSTTIDASNIIDITITEDIGGGAFTIGTFGTTEATMTVVSDALPNVIAGQPISIYFGYYVGTSFEYVPMGVFYAEPRDITHKNLLTTIKAQDKSWSMTNTYITSLDFTGTVYVLDVLTEIQTALSLTMGSNGGLNPGYVRVYDAPQGSYRDVIAQMAMLIGTNAKLNRTGALDFIKANPSATPVQEYGAYDYSSDNYQLTSDEPMNISKLTVNYTHESNEEQVTDTYVYGSGSHGITLETTNVRTQAETNTLGQSVLGTGAVYYGYSATLPGQPHIDLGDVINITEPLGDDYNFIVLSATHGFNGAMKSTFTAVINDSDPQIAGDNIGNSLRDEVEKISNKVGSQGTRISIVEDIAGNTNQYFWHTSTGQDTGAHITQIPQDTFIQNPAQGGSNLLARSNGIAVRNGLTELAVFGATGSRVGLSGGASVTTQSDGIRLYDGGGNNIAFFGTDSNNPSVRIGNTDQRGHIRITPGSGVRFLREDDSTPMAQLASDGLQIWSNDGTTNTSSAFFGAECRVGPTASKNIYVGNGAINFRDNGTSLGEFTGTTARIGTTAGKNIYITSSAVNFRDNGTDIGYVSGTAARLGATSSEGNITFDTTEGFRVWNAGQTASHAQIKDSYGRIGAYDNGHINIYPSGFEIYRKATGDTEPVSIGYFGIYNNKGWARIGALGENHINIDGTYNGIELFRKLDTDTSPVSVAWFGSNTRLGEVANGASRVLIQPSGIDFINRTSAGNDRTISHIGYGGTVHDTDLYDCAYFTFGTRGSGNIGGNSFAAGSGPVASGYNSFAFCVSATASGDYSFALGHDTNAGGSHSYAIGESASTTASESFAIGALAKANGAKQTVLGYANALDSSKLFILGNGYYDSSQPGVPVLVRSNALTVDWSGNVKTSGNIYANGHDTAIGWYDAHYNTATIQSGTSYAKLDASETELSPGRYVVTGTASYSGATSGYRAVGFVKTVGTTDTAIYESRQIVPTIPSTAWRTYVSTTHIINVEETTKIYLVTMQNSGSSLSTDWYIKAIRIS